MFSSLLRGWLKSDDGRMGWGLDCGGREQNRTGSSAGLVVTRAGCQRDAMVTRTNSNQVTAASGPTDESGSLTNCWHVEEMWGHAPSSSSSTSTILHSSIASSILAPAPPTPVPAAATATAGPVAATFSQSLSLSLSPPIHRRRGMPAYRGAYLSL